MQTINRTSLPHTVNHNRKIYSYLAAEPETWKDKKGMINFLADRKYSILKVDVLARNLKGRENLHGKPYQPHGYIFTAPQLTEEHKKELLDWLAKPWTTHDISTTA